VVDALRMVVHLLLVRPLMRLLFGVNVVGRENIEGLDRFVVIANHNSHLDIFLLFAALPADKITRTHPVAARDYFEKPAILFKAVQFLLQPVWVTRGESGLGALKEMQKRLDAGHSLIIFPEGTRGKPGELEEFHAGVGLLARKNTDVPVIPVYLEGPERAFPKEAMFPLPLWNHVTIGPPERLRGESHDIADRLHDHLKALADEELACRQHRELESRRPCCVAVIGIDGSGKSTVSKRLAGMSSGESCFIGDSLELFEDGVPRDAQPLVTEQVRKWMSRHAKAARNLARYKIPKLAELLLRDRLLTQVERWYRPSSIFMDGAPLLNMAGWAILYHEEYFKAEVCSKAIDILCGKDGALKKDPIFSQFPELRMMSRLNLNHLHLPDVVIFLDVDPEVSMARITSRGEKVQAHEDVEKLTKLQSAYRLVCDVLESRCRVCRLDGNKDLETLVDEAQAFVSTREGFRQD